MVEFGSWELECVEEAVHISTDWEEEITRDQSRYSSKAWPSDLLFQVRLHLPKVLQLPQKCQQLGNKWNT